MDAEALDALTFASCSLASLRGFIFEAPRRVFVGFLHALKYIQHYAELFNHVSHVVAE